jgi:hypothetical protein
MSMPSSKSLIATSALLAIASFVLMTCAAFIPPHLAGALTSSMSLGLAAASLLVYGCAVVRDLRKGEEKVSSTEAHRAG